LKNPMIIWMSAATPTEGLTAGLVKRDGNTITIIYALPGTNVPTSSRQGESTPLRPEAGGKESE